jgi:hypothetical protein
MVIYQDAGLPTQSSTKRQSEIEGGAHFLAKPAALAFGTPGNMATAQQEDGWTQPQTPYDFMGPTLWGTSLATFDAAHPGHLDMLHNSPLSSGIAWVEGNQYFLYDGAHRAIAFYDFNQDHGLGGTDHSDGELYRYVDGQLGYEPGVPSHVVFDGELSRVYAADTANGRIVSLNPNTGSLGGYIEPNYDGGTQRYMDGAELSVLIDGSQFEPAMLKPSGMELHDDILFITDHANSVIYGFDRDGNLIDYLETGMASGSLMGMTFDTEGSLLIVDSQNNGIIKFSVAE